MQNTELRSMYLAILQAKVPESAHMKDKSLDGVFKEFVRKLCHTRVQEFLDSFKQQNAAHKGSATLAGQNLRDSLLCHSEKQTENLIITKKAISTKLRKQLQSNIIYQCIHTSSSPMPLVQGQGEHLCNL